jgi:hypothetical protein
MADHYRALTQTLVNLGFLFRRQGEGRREVWRNRRTDQEVVFDRDEVAKSRAAADAVLTAVQAVPNGKPIRAAEGAAAAKPSRKSAPSSKSTAKPTAKPSGARATARKGVKQTARRKGTR